ncbi:MAG: hypothetical protein EU529_09525 [Promethearchaeota archaeon]|nr:MAG: hypothetical protein EU529_09525 [Candidatus Lokiarchaeota archaeon]
MSDIISLIVEKAKKKDKESDILRFEIEKLGLQTGDMVKLIGKNESAGIALPCYPKDKKKGIIRLSERMRQIIAVNYGDSVQVRKENVKVAKLIVLTPLRSEPRLNLKSSTLDPVILFINPTSVKYIKRELKNTFVSIYEIINISLGENNEMMFKITQLKPEEKCIIKEETVVNMADLINALEKNIDYFEEPLEPDSNERYIRTINLAFKHGEAIKIDPRDFRDLDPNLNPEQIMIEMYKNIMNEHDNDE